MHACITPNVFITVCCAVTGLLDSLSYTKAVWCMQTQTQTRALVGVSTGVGVLLPRTAQRAHLTRAILASL